MRKSLSDPGAVGIAAPTARSPMVDVFVGRDHERGALRAGLDSALAGRGRLFLISGEPGIGKSRLAEEFSEEAARRGMRVLWGRCWEGGGAPAYWPIIQVLRGCAERPDFPEMVETLGSGIAPLASLVPEIIRTVPSPQETHRLEQVDPKEARFRLFDAVARLLGAIANREPIAVIIDDLHDADSATLEMLRFMARSLKDAPVLGIGTHREAEVKRSPELWSAMAELARESNQLPLGGLNRADVADLVRARTGITPKEQFLATLHHTTEGNPLFLGGVLQTLLSEGRLEDKERLRPADLKLPANVRGVIKTRLKGISSRTMTIISIAAVLGNRFELAPLERAADTRGQEVLQSLDEAASLSVVAPIPGSSTSFRFTHALVRSEVYEGIGSAERARLHQQVGEALEAVHGNDQSGHLAEIANHFRLAISSGTAEKAINYSTLAGKAAQRAYAYEEAISQFETALSLMKQHHVQTRERADLLVELGSLLYWSDTRLGIEHLESAVTAYEGLKLKDEAARCEALLGGIFASPGQRIDTSRALVHLRKAEKVLGHGPPSPELVNLYLGLGLTAGRTNRLREALAAFRRAMKIGQEVGGDELWVAPASLLAMYSVLAGRISESQALLARLWATLPALKEQMSFHTAVRACCGCQFLLNDPRSAREWLVKGLDSPLPGRYQRDAMKLGTANTYWVQADIAAARRHLADWRQFDESLRLAAESLSAAVDFDWERLKVSLQAEIDSDSKADGLDVRYIKQEWLATLLRGSGENQKAEEILLSALATCDGDQPLLHREMLIRPALALSLVLAGKLEAAQTQIRRVADILAEGQDWRGLAGRYHLAAGFCAAATGNQAESEGHFVDAVETFRRWTLPWLEAETFCCWGYALGAAHQFRAADEKFDAAIEIYRRIDVGQATIDGVEMTRAIHAPRTAAESHGENECVLRREGEYWTIVYDGRTSRLKDSRGMNYIAHLISHPGQQFHVRELGAMLAPASDSFRRRLEGKGPGAARAAESDGFAEMIDLQAANAYRRRADELRGEIDEAERLADLGRAQRAQSELGTIEAELRKTIGIGGRRRSFRSAADRERLRVRKAINVSIGKIRSFDPKLARHLATSIHTGYFCSYQPAGGERWTV